MFESSSSICQIDKMKEFLIPFFDQNKEAKKEVNIQLRKHM
jgi:hypothetical protein